MFSLRAVFGLDTRDFSQKAQQAERTVNKLRSRLSQLGLGAGAFQVIAWFRNVIREADNMESGVDRNVDAIQRFSAQVSDLRRNVMQFGFTFIGTLNRFGESVGDAISMAMGNTWRDLQRVRESEAQLRAIQAQYADIQKANAEAAQRAITAQKATLALEEELAAVRKANGDAELQRQQRLEEIARRRAQLTAPGAVLTGRGQEELQKLEQESLRITIQQEREQAQQRQTQFDQQATLLRQIAELQRSSAMAAMTAQEQVLALTEEEARLRHEIRYLGENTSRNQGEGLTKLLDAERQLLEVTRQRAEAQSRIESEQEQQAQAVDRARQNLEELQARIDFSRLSRSEQMLDLSDQILTKQKEINRARESGSDLQELELEREKLTLVEQRRQLEEEIRREIDQQIARGNELIRQQADLQTAMQASMRDRTAMGLSDLAQGGAGRRLQMDAQRIQALEQQAAIARARGQEGRADDIAERAADLRQRIPGMRDSDRDPEEVFKSALKDTNDELTEIVNAINDLKNEPL